MMNFAFATATEIRFGRGELERALPQIAGLGRLLVVHGRGGLLRAGVARAIEALRPALPVAVTGEPELAEIEEMVLAARAAEVTAVVAIGGGAVIDAGKALAALIPSPHGALRYLEVVGEGRALDAAPLPFVAIPTTAGTGAEVTRNAVIQVAAHRRKVSLRDTRMLPRLAVVDPGLTDHCPRGVTLASGLDAITQVIEPFVSTKANPLTDALCRDAIPRGLVALKRLMEAEDPQARDEMAWVSLCGGLALANAGLGVVHGLAGPLGGLSGAAHGALCGAMLAPALAMNRARARDTQRLDQVLALIATCHPGGLDAWARAQGLAGLDTLGVTFEMRALACEAAASSSSMKANPAELSAHDLMDLMEAAR